VLAENHKATDIPQKALIIMANGRTNILMDIV
jgi:hypothetical protein